MLSQHHVAESARAKRLKLGVLGNLPLWHADLSFAASARLTRPTAMPGGRGARARRPLVTDIHQQLITTAVEAVPRSGPRTCSVTVCDALPWPFPSTATVTYTACCPATTDWPSGWGGCRSCRNSH